MLTQGAFGNLVNRYRAVLHKCRLINTFGSLAVAAMLVAGGAASAEAVDFGTADNPGKSIIEFDGTDIIHTGDVYLDVAGTAVEFAQQTGKTEGTISLGSESSVIDIRTTGTSVSLFDDCSPQTDDKGVINLTGKTIYISSINDAAGAWTNAVYAGSDVTLHNENNNTINIKSTEGTTIIARAQNATQAEAIAAHSGAIVNIEGPLYVEATTIDGSQLGDAITTRGGATINIGQSGAPVQIIGNIEFDYDGKTSGTPVDAYTNIALNGKDSYWIGNTVTSWNDKPSDTFLEVTKMHLKLSDGASWTPVAATETGSTQYAPLANLALDNGVINLNPDVDVQVDKMTGSGTVNLAANLKEGENAGTFTVATATDAALNVNLTGVTSDDITAAQARDLMSNVSATSGEMDLTGSVAEGLVNGAMNIGTDGTVSMGKNHVMESALEVASITSVSLDRILNNDIRKRMGDLRSVSGESGVWMRWDGGRLKGDSGLTNDFNTVQVGADTLTAWDNVRVGLAASFTYGDGDHSRGSSEMEGVAVAGYGVWMADNGMFADVIARVGSFDTDVRLAGYKGSIDSVVASLSGEFGWRFDIYDQFYVEPQVELAYTYVDGDKFSLGSARYDVDGTDSLIGRAGISAGWKFGDRGDVYARASVVQQFLGDAKISGWNGSAMNVYEIDGEDTWFEYGIGTNLRLTESASVWADLERTEGAQIDEEWRGTVGLRYSF